MNEAEKTADHLCDQLVGLSVKAHESKLKFLAYLIEIAAMEAAREARTRRNRRVAKNMPRGWPN